MDTGADGQYQQEQCEEDMIWEVNERKSILFPLLRSRNAGSRKMSIFALFLLVRDDNDLDHRCMLYPSWALFFQEGSNLSFQKGTCQNMRKEKQIDFEGNGLDAFFELQHIP